MSIHWTKRPTYEELIKDLEKDYKVKLPDRAALSFYDSFAHTQFQQMQHNISTSQQNVDNARDHAMSMAADDEDTSKHTMLQRAAQMRQQNSAALQEAQRLNSQMAETHERSRQQQAEGIAKLVAHQQIERGNRERMHAKIIEDLQQHPKVAPKPIPPPPPMWAGQYIGLFGLKRPELISDREGMEFRLRTTRRRKGWPSTVIRDGRLSSTGAKRWHSLRGRPM